MGNFLMRLLMVSHEISIPIDHLAHFVSQTKALNLRSLAISGQ